MTSHDPELDKMVEAIDYLQPTANKIYFNMMADGIDKSYIMEDFLFLVRSCVSFEQPKLQKWQIHSFTKKITQSMAEVMFLEARDQMTNTDTIRGK
jgi:hypothetical protein